MSEILFAYGSLRPGRAPAEIAGVAAKLRAVGEGFVRGALYDLGGYPGAVPDAKAKGWIAGTVMELPEDESVSSSGSTITKALTWRRREGERVCSRAAGCGVGDGRHGGVLVL